MGLPAVDALPQLGADDRRATLEIADVLADNPGLKPRIGEAIARAYRRALIEAARETGLDDTTFPAGFPYSFDDIMLRMLAR